MSDDRDHPRGGSLAFVLMILLISYPLSIGPMALLCEIGVFSDENLVLVLFYRPVVVMANTFPAVSNIFLSDIDFWAKLAA